MTGPFAPVSDSPWLTISGVTNGVVTFAFAENPAAARTGHIFLLGQSVTVSQPVLTGHFSLSSTNHVEGPTAGTDSVVLVAGGNWNATSNDAWLHVAPNYQSGSGSTNVVFTFDANPGATRTGTLTIAGLTLTVTQAGSAYVAAKPVLLVNVGIGDDPNSIGVDSAGNVYIANVSRNNIEKWSLASNTITTLVSSNLGGPYGVAVDRAGNGYIANTGYNAIMKWVAASNTVITLVSGSSGIRSPYGLAIDDYGNVFFAGISGVSKWTAATKSVSTLVSAGLFDPHAVALDRVGNVYIADSGNNAIKKWSAANGSVTTLVASGLNYPPGVTVDALGNVYIADIYNHAIKMWSANSGAVTTLASGFNQPVGVALDKAGNLYIADYGADEIYELLSHTFVDATAKVEPAVAGSDALPVVLPATASLTGPFTPASDAAWLTITGVANGVVSFAFTANPAATNRTAQISLLGQKIAVSQAGGNWPVLTGFAVLGNGAFQFGFSNQPGRQSFTVWSSTNLALPLTNWTVLGMLTNDGSDQFQFTDPSATNDVQRYYRVSSP